MENSLENQKVDPSELPFLVTHWLSNFQHSSYKPNESGPLNQIKKAASELALAFEELGSFGKTNLVCLLQLCLQFHDLCPPF